MKVRRALSLVTSRKDLQSILVTEACASLAATIDPMRPMYSEVEINLPYLDLRARLRREVYSWKARIIGTVRGMADLCAECITQLTPKADMRDTTSYDRFSAPGVMSS